MKYIKKYRVFFLSLLAAGTILLSLFFIEVLGFSPELIILATPIAFCLGAFAFVIQVKEVLKILRQPYVKEIKTGDEDGRG